MKLQWMPINITILKVKGILKKCMINVKWPKTGFFGKFVISEENEQSEFK